jgi:hypothetical protein
VWHKQVLLLVITMIPIRTMIGTMHDIVIDMAMLVNGANKVA